MLLLIPVVAMAGCAQPTDAADITFDWPLDCTLGETCWIARYVDRGEDKSVADYMCKHRSQDKHRGTDIMVSDTGVLASGVPILAVAPGKILRMRDGVDDGAPYKKGEDCGNAYVIQHENGYTSQYCHLKNASLSKNIGDTVRAGEQIALMGLSGQTEYPHLHIGIRKNGTLLDPFDGGGYEQACSGSSETSLWRDHPDYAPFTLLPPKFSVAPEPRENRWAAQAESISPDASALILTGRAFGASRGDVWSFRITDPDGKLFAEHQVATEKTQQFRSQFFGKRAPAGGFKPGIWTGTISLEQDGYRQTQTVQILVSSATK
ncbi:M23 family metallopeptidase [Kordiimonas sediminis]|nr:M23 family metallopeptidase [Kordiimonas sediminis]